MKCGYCSPSSSLVQWWSRKKHVDTAPLCTLLKTSYRNHYMVNNPGVTLLSRLIGPFITHVHAVRNSIIYTNTIILLRSAVLNNRGSEVMGGVCLGRMWRACCHSNVLFLDLWIFWKVIYSDSENTNKNNAVALLRLLLCTTIVVVAMSVCGRVLTVRRLGWLSLCWLHHILILHFPLHTVSLGLRYC